MMHGTITNDGVRKIKQAKAQSKKIVFGSVRMTTAYENNESVLVGKSTEWFGNSIGEVIGTSSHIRVAGQVHVCNSTLAILCNDNSSQWKSLGVYARIEGDENETLFTCVSLPNGNGSLNNLTLLEIPESLDGVVDDFGDIGCVSSSPRGVSLVTRDKSGDVTFSAKKIKTNNLSIAGHVVDPTEKVCLAICTSGYAVANTITSPSQATLWEVSMWVDDAALSYDDWGTELRVVKETLLSGTYRILSKRVTDRDNDLEPVLIVQEVRNPVSEEDGEESGSTEVPQYEHRDIQEGGKWLFCGMNIKRDGTYITVKSTNDSSVTLYDGRLVYVDSVTEDGKLHISRACVLDRNYDGSGSAFSVDVDVSFEIIDGDDLWDIQMYEPPKAVDEQTAYSLTNERTDLLSYCIGYCESHNMYIGVHDMSWNLGDTITPV